MTNRTMYTMLQIMDCRTPFYASDFNIPGGIINSLHRNGIISPTGNKKEFMIEIREDTFKRVYTKEWKLAKPKKINQIINWNIYEINWARKFAKLYDKKFGK